MACRVDLFAGMSRRLPLQLPLVLALALAAPPACAVKSPLIHRPTDATVDAAITELWTAEIRRVARDGDWLLSRAYYATSDLIVLGTSGEALSHGSIYDATRGMVIESIASGVREIPLAQFVQRNHLVIVVRPSNMTAADGRAAVARARSKIGAPFDVTGMFGFSDPDKFYCSELVYWASQTAARTGSHERVVTPSDLMKYGEVIYWSGTRDDAQLGE
ncbi:MAG TPA: YiiX/YebB-like N1pC/P60 family cysteine hydrolase, partial [Kofleriaceae bacterium]|nr:YiiX/YebB-like N1pC/P60 family cysteine hydrolase [Kofleriaceae bacterium]